MDERLINAGSPLAPDAFEPRETHHTGIETMHRTRSHSDRFAERTRRAIAPALLLSMLVLAASALASARLHVSLTASAHKPKVGTKWTATVRARSGSSAAAGAVSLDVLFGGKVVYHVASGTLRHGVYRKTLRWPLRASGYELTMRARVTSGGAHHDQFYAFRVLK